MLIHLHILITTMLPVLLLTSCDVTQSSGPSMSPIGDGLRFLGVALVVAVLVAVIGMSRRGGGRHG